MAGFTKTSLANRALDLVGKDTMLDYNTATNTYAKNVQRNFEPVFKRCLRKSDWPFALKRVSLSPDAATPENQFSYQFTLPSDFVKLSDLWPKYFGEPVPHTVEGGKLLCNENAVTIKYVSGLCIKNPTGIDPNFAEYFCHELAVALTYKMTDSVQLRKELRETAKEIFEEATSLHSQEGTDDPIPESEWITVRYGAGQTIHDEIRIEGLE